MCHPPPPPPPAHPALAPAVLPPPAPPIPSHQPKPTIRAPAHLSSGLSLGGGGLLASARAAHDRLHFGRRRTSLDECTQYIGVASAGRHQHACGPVLAPRRDVPRRPWPLAAPAIKNKQRTPTQCLFLGFSNSTRAVAHSRLGQHTHIGDDMRPAPWWCPDNTTLLRATPSPPLQVAPAPGCSPQKRSPSGMRLRAPSCRALG